MISSWIEEFQTPDLQWLVAFCENTVVGAVAWSEDAYKLETRSAIDYSVRVSSSTVTTMYPALVSESMMSTVAACVVLRPSM